MLNVYFEGFVRKVETHVTKLKRYPLCVMRE